MGTLTGDRIRYVRRSRGYTQEFLANKVGTTKATINKYESGVVKNIKRSMIAALSEVLGVSPGYLMGWEDENGRVTLAPPTPQEVLAVDAVEQELLRIFRALPVRSQVELLSKAYELEGNK